MTVSVGYEPLIVQLIPEIFPQLTGIGGKIGTQVQLLVGRLIEVVYKHGFKAPPKPSKFITASAKPQLPLKPVRKTVTLLGIGNPAGQPEQLIPDALPINE